MPGPNPATPQPDGAGAPEGTPAPDPNAAPAADPNLDPSGQPAPTPAQAAPGDPAAMQAAADAANQQAAEGTPWYNGLDEKLHEPLKAFATPEDALAAIEAGGKYTTAKEVGDYTFEFNDATVDQNAPELVHFKQFCLDNNISPEQAQKTLEYQTGIMDAAADQAKTDGEAQLRSDWGNEFDGNLTKALTALTAIDRDTGGQLAATLKATGSANNPEVVKALLWVHERIGEDNLGAGGPGGAPLNTPISTEDAYAELYGKK